jgi:hypothetical protein
MCSRHNSGKTGFASISLSTTVILVIILASGGGVPEPGDHEDK